MWSNQARITQVLAYLWSRTQSRFISTQKRADRYSAFLTEQVWSIKDLLYGIKNTIPFPCGEQRVILSWQNTIILPARVANHSTGFESNHLARSLSHIIRRFIISLAPWVGKINKILPCNWLSQRVRSHHLAQKGLCSVYRKNYFHEDHTWCSLSHI